eukprot:364727-Chlamydomonas_euryale.AAC.4
MRRNDILMRYNMRRNDILMRNNLACILAAARPHGALEDVKQRPPAPAPFLPCYAIPTDQRTGMPPLAAHTCALAPAALSYSDVPPPAVPSSVASAASRRGLRRRLPPCLPPAPRHAPVAAAAPSGTIAGRWQAKDGERRQEAGGRHEAGVRQEAHVTRRRAVKERVKQSGMRVR